ncbi:related to phenylalanine ammonia-lyase [Fusarium fujikuroi]|nr:related to phenylalanine ammonia-lyase [Fusarium fujikuroi]
MASNSWHQTSRNTKDAQHPIQDHRQDISFQTDSQMIRKTQKVPGFHAHNAYTTWVKIRKFKAGDTIFINGTDLDVASVIAVAKYGCNAQVAKTDALTRIIENSVNMLEEFLSKGLYAYGVNTGFGGSADTRTGDLVALQSALLQLTQAGILIEDHTGACKAEDSHSMPVTWVRAAMLIRCNTVLRGQSAVRLELVEAALHMLRKGMTPIVPLRGSISASGDLMPLSYIAGMLEGNPDIHVRLADSSVVPADKALELADLEPFALKAKEGLGLVNGTAASAAVGCLAIHESDKLALLAQALTAMSCEALAGKADNYHPFISNASPHPGQIECAANILRFLQGSFLIEALEKSDKTKPGLCQDRYALRGAPQWLGPQLEDLSSVLSQLVVELNSTSDNPLIDVQSGHVYSGANFIASSTANGMEKIRLSLQMIGKLLFSLSTEMINPTLNKGLPPNLAADDPSLSFTAKGIDISMAAYMSELAFFANPVTSHVQSAEMSNQSINSLALISGRLALQAADITAHMCAAHLYIVCQALDLRVLHNTFLQALQHDANTVLEPFINNSIPDQERKDLKDRFYKALVDSWTNSASHDLEARCGMLSTASLPVLLEYCMPQNTFLESAKVKQFTKSLQDLAIFTFVKRRDEFFKSPNTKSFLGHASKRLYSFQSNKAQEPGYGDTFDGFQAQFGYSKSFALA